MWLSAEFLEGFTPKLQGIIEIQQIPSPRDGEYVNSPYYL